MHTPGHMRFERVIGTFSTSGRCVAADMRTSPVGRQLAGDIGRGHEGAAYVADTPAFRLGGPRRAWLGD